jgi:hypothetical protein
MVQAQPHEQSGVRVAMIIRGGCGADFDVHSPRCVVIEDSDLALGRRSYLTPRV